MSSRIARWLGCFVSILLVMFAAGVTVRAQDSEPAQPPRSPGRSASGSAPSKYLVIPGFGALNLTSVQREIGLTDEQRQNLKNLSVKYQANVEKFQAGVQQEVGDLRGLEPKEQQKRMAEYRDQAAHMAQSVRKRAETYLSTQQLRKLQSISFRLYVAEALTNPTAQEQLKLSRSQRSQLDAVYEQTADKMQKLQRETAEQVLEVLTPEQEAKLRQQMQSQ